MTPLRRSERFERQANPARVVRSTATCARNSCDGTGTPEGDGGGPVCPTTRQTRPVAPRGVAGLRRWRRTECRTARPRAPGCGTSDNVHLVPYCARDLGERMRRSRRRAAAGPLDPRESLPPVARRGSQARISARTSTSSRRRSLRGGVRTEILLTVAIDSIAAGAHGSRAEDLMLGGRRSSPARRSA